MHIFGGGNQADDIQKYVDSNDCGVICHGFKAKDELNQLLGSFHASIVPLAVPIKGAVPSKIYDLLPHGTPILFCGGGEGEQIILEHHLGLVSQPGNYDQLRDNIRLLERLSDTDYCSFRQNCLTASQTTFSFNKQMESFLLFLQGL